MNYLKNLLANYKFDPSKFRLGMRTIKTGLAVFLVLLIFHLFPNHRGSKFLILTFYLLIIILKSIQVLF